MNRLVLLICISVLGGCAVGPDYVKPGLEVPAAFKEAGDWKVAEPKDALPKGKWWEAFNDPVLNGLAEQVSVSNQSLKVSEARYAQARAAVASARSQFYPTLGVDASAQRSKGRSLDGSGGSIGDSYTASLGASWEIDLWGRIRRSVESSQATEAASAADVEAARLSLQAELATNYFLLRVADAQIDLLEGTVKAFQQSYDITQNRYKAGVAAKVDVVQAEAQVLSVRAQAIDLRATRASLEHAIAVLTGKPPAMVSVERAAFTPRIPEVPAGLPSTLLERRPDIAAAERRMAAANAQIGVATAAYFPTLDLAATGGIASDAVTRLFNASNRFWSVGAGLAGNLIDFGARSAAVDSARANYDAVVANYRDTVLQAFREVEDNLATVRWLSEAAVVQEQAARAARETVSLTLNQYKAGTVSFLNVAQVQASQLSEDRSTMILLGRRLSSTVGLIRAIGGDWTTPLPSQPR